LTSTGLIQQQLYIECKHSLLTLTAFPTLLSATVLWVVHIGFYWVYIRRGRGVFFFLFSMELILSNVKLQLYT